MNVPQMRIGPLLQYFCSTCGKVLKEASSLDLQNDHLREECPGCGALLVETLQNRRISSTSLWQQQSPSNSSQKPAKGFSVDFQTAYQQVEARNVRLAFDIEKLDSLVNLTSHGSLCIIGEQMYARLLSDRLCVNSMLPRRYGGIGEGYSKIIAIDAGNCSDAYPIANFARQYGLEVRRVLQNMGVSRVFILYQLAHLIIHQLPRIIDQLSSTGKNYLVIIYDLLHFFVSDPHIDKADAKQLIKEIASSTRKLSEDTFVVLNGENDTQTPVQQALLLQQRLTEVKHPDHTLITYPNLGHEFHPSSQWFTENGPIPEYVLQDIFSWLSAENK